MASYLGSNTELKEAVRKILGNLLTKAVQELYSAAGRKGPTGIIKKNFSATHFYSWMTGKHTIYKLYKYNYVIKLFSLLLIY